MGRILLTTMVTTQNSNTIMLLKKLRIRKLIRIVKRKFLKHLKKKTDKDEGNKNTDKEISSAPSFATEVSEEFVLSEDYIPSYHDMVTSTPLKMKFMKKIIILHDASDLKIYEDVDQVKKVDISAFTRYEDVDEDVDSQERIYENLLF